MTEVAPSPADTLDAIAALLVPPTDPRATVGEARWTRVDALWRQVGASGASVAVGGWKLVADRLRAEGLEVLPKPSSDHPSDAWQVSTTAKASRTRVRAVAICRRSDGAPQTVRPGTIEIGSKHWLAQLQRAAQGLSGPYEPARRWLADHAARAVTRDDPQQFLSAFFAEIPPETTVGRDLDPQSLAPVAKALQAAVKVAAKHLRLTSSDGTAPLSSTRRGWQVLVPELSSQRGTVAEPRRVWTPGPRPEALARLETARARVADREARRQVQQCIAALDLWHRAPPGEDGSTGATGDADVRALVQALAERCGTSPAAGWDWWTLAHAVADHTPAQEPADTARLAWGYEGAPTPWCPMPPDQLPDERGVPADAKVVWVCSTPHPIAGALRRPPRSSHPRFEDVVGRLRRLSQTAAVEATRTRELVEAIVALREPGLLLSGEYPEQVADFHNDLVRALAGALGGSIDDDVGAQIELPADAPPAVARLLGLRAGEVVIAPAHVDHPAFGHLQTVLSAARTRTLPAQVLCDIARIVDLGLWSDERRGDELAGAIHQLVWNLAEAASAGDDATAELLQDVFRSVWSNGLWAGDAATRWTRPSATVPMDAEDLAVSITAHQLASGHWVPIRTADTVGKRVLDRLAPEGGSSLPDGVLTKWLPGIARKIGEGRWREVVTPCVSIDQTEVGPFLGAYRELVAKYPLEPTEHAPFWLRPAPPDQVDLDAAWQAIDTHLLCLYYSARRDPVFDQAFSLIEQRVAGHVWLRPRSEGPTDWVWSDLPVGTVIRDGVAFGVPGKSARLLMGRFAGPSPPLLLVFANTLWEYKRRLDKDGGTLAEVREAVEEVERMVQAVRPPAAGEAGSKYDVRTDGGVHQRLFELCTTVIPNWRAADKGPAVMQLERLWDACASLRAELRVVQSKWEESRKYGP